MNKALLQAIATATAANTVVYLTQADALPLMQHNPPLITVDGNAADPSDANKRAAKITDAGVEFLKSDNSSKPTASHFAVQTGGFERPKATRRGGGGSGAPSKYPFDGMGVGQFFFVANSDVKGNDAVKTMSSAVGSANQRYATETGETKSVTRVKRDNKRRAIKGADGKNEMETVTLPVKEFTRKYVVSPVKAGKQYGDFTAPADGAVVNREK